jgi:ABC-type microcin C transport system permease subunit YejB
VTSDQNSPTFISVSLIDVLMMETEPVPETFVFNITLLRLLTRENFIAFIRRQYVKTYRYRYRYSILST